MTLKETLIMMYSENLYNEMLFNLYAKKDNIPAAEWRRVTDMSRTYGKTARQLGNALQRHFKDGWDVMAQATRETQERFNRDMAQFLETEKTA